MSDLPVADELGLVEGSVIAIPKLGLTLYRLVTPPISIDDFAPARARRGMKAPEILRIGLSHYLSASAAATVIRHAATRVAAVHLDESARVHVAKTFHHPEHVTVWAPADTL